MHIAIFGTRGLPANYSGLEACVEETAIRLVQRGHSVTVYCRNKKGKYKTSNFHGVNLVWLPAIPSKHGETISHTFLSFLHALMNINRDTLIHVYGVGNSPFLYLFNMLGYQCIISVDGQDWRRAKWGTFASSYLRCCANIAAKNSSFCIVDSRTVQSYYARTFKANNVHYIPYGHTEEATTTSDILNRLGVSSREYVLFVGRIVPEKGVHYLLKAFQEVKTNKKLLIVGAIQDHQYKAELQRLAPTQAIFSGPIYGSDCAILYRNAYLYVQPSDVDGTSHALLSAMGAGIPALVSNIPENLETIGGVGFSFQQGNVSDLRNKLCLLLKQPNMLSQIGAAAAKRVEYHYNWLSVTDKIEGIYRLVQNKHK